MSLKGYIKKDGEFVSVSGIKDKVIYEVVEEIPSASEAESNKIYFLDSPEDGSNGYYDGVPCGTIVPYGGTGNVPVGYLLCNGTSVSKITYPSLFEVIGYTYGGTEGEEYFSLPDLTASTMRYIIKAFAGASNTTKDIEITNLANEVNLLSAENAKFKALGLYIDSDGDISQL